MTENVTPFFFLILFFFFLKTGFLCLPWNSVDQAGLQLSDSPASAYWEAEELGPKACITTTTQQFVRFLSKLPTPKFPPRDPQSSQGGVHLDRNGSRQDRLPSLTTEHLCLAHAQQPSAEQSLHPCLEAESQSSHHVQRTGISQNKKLPLWGEGSGSSMSKFL